MTGPRHSDDFFFLAKRKYLRTKRLQTIPTRDAATELGVSTTFLKRVRLEAGITPPSRIVDEVREASKRALLKTKEFGLKEKRSTMSIPDLCKLVDLPYHTVFYLQKRLKVEPYGQKYRSDSFRQPLVNSNKELEVIQLAREWHRPKGMTEHLETLND